MKSYVVQRAPWQPVSEVRNSHNVVCFDATFRITRLPGAPRHVCGRFLIQQRQQCRRVHHVRRKSHKTRQGGLRIKRRVVQPKIFATGGPRCPVKLLKTFLSHRPEEMKSNGPFYLAVIERPKSQLWYKRQRMGIHSINSFMKSMAAQAEIEDKRLTNHSARKTLVKKLKAANQPRSPIIGVTGHTNERSLAD